VSPVVLGAARLKILPSDLETCAATNDASLKGNTPAAAAAKYCLEMEGGAA
jgi:hypothetical protein